MMPQSETENLRTFTQQKIIIVQPTVTSKTSPTKENRLLLTLKGSKCFKQGRKDKYTVAEIQLLPREAVQLCAFCK